MSPNAKVPVLMDAARRSAAQGQFQQAAQFAVDALEADEDCVPAYELIARIQLDHGNYEPARWAVGEALQRQPDSAELRLLSARIYRREGELEPALMEAEAAMQRAPDLPQLAAFQIELLTLGGRYDEAQAKLVAALDQRPKDVDLGIVFADWAQRLGKTDQAIARLEAHLRELPPQDEARCTLLFRLGKLREQQGAFDQAFAAIRAANECTPNPWNAEAYDESVSATIRSWTADFMASAPRATQPAGRALFIVGMPRSGTTLVEQILASHPQVAGGGELPHFGRLAFAAAERPEQLLPFQDDPGRLDADTVAQIGRDYLAGLDEVSPDAQRVTDKMPANHALLGLVELALPGARIIHCQRDPRDSCLSCYFTHFRHGNHYASDLEQLGRYALAEQRLMAHWREVLDLPLLDLRYEELVEDPERHARQIVEFSGLEWHPDCLDFHRSGRFVDTASAMQVRNEIYRSSVGRFRRYEAHLAPLLAVLGTPA